MRPTAPGTASGAKRKGEDWDPKRPLAGQGPWLALRGLGILPGNVPAQKRAETGERGQEGHYDQVNPPWGCVTQALSPLHTHGGAAQGSPEVCLVSTHRLSGAERLFLQVTFPQQDAFCHSPMAYSQLFSTSFMRFWLPEHQPIILPNS